MINRNPALLHHLFEVTIAQRVRRVPADANQNNFLRKPHALHRQHRLLSNHSQADIISDARSNLLNETKPPGAAELLEVHTNSKLADADFLEHGFVTGCALSGRKNYLNSLSMSLNGGWFSVNRAFVQQ